MSSYYLFYDEKAKRSFSIQAMESDRHIKSDDVISIRYDGKDDFYPNATLPDSNGFFNKEFVSSIMQNGRLMQAGKINLVCSAPDGDTEAFNKSLEAFIVLIKVLNPRCQVVLFILIYKQTTSFKSLSILQKSEVVLNYEVDIYGNSRNIDRSPCSRIYSFIFAPISDIEENSETILQIDKFLSQDRTDLIRPDTIYACTPVREYDRSDEIKGVFLKVCSSVFNRRINSDNTEGVSDFTIDKYIKVDCGDFKEYMHNYIMSMMPVTNDKLPIEDNFSNFIDMVFGTGAYGEICEVAEKKFSEINGCVTEDHCKAVICDMVVDLLEESSGNIISIKNTIKNHINNISRLDSEKDLSIVIDKRYSFLHIKTKKKWYQCIEIIATEFVDKLMNRLKDKYVSTIKQKIRSFDRIDEFLDNYLRYSNTVVASDDDLKRIQIASEKYYNEKSTHINVKELRKEIAKIMGKGKNYADALFEYCSQYVEQNNYAIIDGSFNQLHEVSFRLQSQPDGENSVALKRIIDYMSGNNAFNHLSIIPRIYMVGEESVLFGNIDWQQDTEFNIMNSDSDKLELLCLKRIQRNDNLCEEQNGIIIGE